MTDYTYVPATGTISFGQAGNGHKNGSGSVVGEVPPVIPDKRDRGIDLDRVSRVDGKERVPVMEVMAGRGREHGVEHVTDEYMSTCREIMLLPALLKVATYTNLHSVFTEVPLEECRAEHRLPDGRGQLRDTDTKTSSHRHGSESYVVFNAGKCRVWRYDTVDDLYIGPGIFDSIKLSGILEEMKEKHEQAAFDALDGIRDEVSLDATDGQAGNKAIAAKLDGIIQDTRTKYGSEITHVVMGMSMWHRYMSDPRFKGMPIPESPTGISGTVQLPGCVTAVISQMEDIDTKDVIYAVDRRRGALYGLGPMELESYNTSRIYGTGITEYYQYMITDNHAKRADGDPLERRTALRINVPE